MYSSQFPNTPSAKRVLSHGPPEKKEAAPPPKEEKPAEKETINIECESPHHFSPQEIEVLQRSIARMSAASRPFRAMLMPFLQDYPEYRKSFAALRTLNDIDIATSPLFEVTADRMLGRGLNALVKGLTNQKELRQRMNRMADNHRKHHIEGSHVKKIIPFIVKAALQHGDPEQAEAIKNAWIKMLELFVDRHDSD